MLEMKHTLDRPSWGAAIGTALLIPMFSTTAQAQCTPTLTAQQARLEKAIAGSNDYFGRAVDIDGDWAVVGSHGDDNSNGGDAGSVIVYKRSGATWSQHSLLQASNGGTSDVFGISVAIDSGIIVVGAYGDNLAGAADAGSAYVFDLNAGAWTETANLVAPSPSTNDQFGWDVDLSGDSILVGSRYHDAPGFIDTGAAFAYRLVAGTWTFEAQLVPSVLQNGLESGWSVALDGDTAVLGAPGHHIVGQVDQGSAFVFQRTNNAWNEISNLSSPGGSGGDAFGNEVAIGAGRIVIGAHLADDTAGTNQGEVTVYSQQFGLWSFEQQLHPSSAAANDEFGTGIAVDDGIILVGAAGVDAEGSNSGAAYVFTACGGFNPWTEHARILPWDAHAGDWFGYAVGLSGSTAITGAHGFNGTGTDVGAAYIHKLSRGEFTLYGFGDGSGAACPCANESTAGFGQGCQNSNGRGAALSAWGSDVATANDLTFVAGNLLPSAPALLFSGTSQTSPGHILGDGLLVVGGGIVRLSVAAPSPDGNASWGPFNGASSGWAPNQTRYFQVWYRDPLGSPCANAFNLSNGLQVDFQ